MLCCCCLCYVMVSMVCVVLVDVVMVKMVEMVSLGCVLAISLGTAVYQNGHNSFIVGNLMMIFGVLESL